MSASRRTSMIRNSLMLNSGLTFGPILFETLFRHYLERDKDAVPLRKDELLYDEAFNIVKVRAQPSTLQINPLTFTIHSRHSSRERQPSTAILLLCTT